MKNAVTLTLLCVLAMSAAACTAADTPMLVGEKVVMTLDKSILHVRDQGVSTMRLSPDGRRVLYLRQKMYKPAKPGGWPHEIKGYKLHLLDLKTGKDTALPTPALHDEEFVVMWMSMTLFDPEGKTIVVPAGQDANKNGVIDERVEKCKVGLYDIASGKLTTLEIRADMTFPSFHPNGKTLLVLTVDLTDGSESLKLFTTPTDKIKFSRLSKAGMPRSISPASDLMVMLLRSDDGKRPQGKGVIYDLKTESVKCELPGDKFLGRRMMAYNPQWTADGRYLYYYSLEFPQRDGRRQRDDQTRIWDAGQGKQVGVFPGMAPIGPGPGKDTMVLRRQASVRGFSVSVDEPRVVLHVHNGKALGRTYSLGDTSIHPISTQGKWLLYIRKNAEGKKTAYIAEIALP